MAEYYQTAGCKIFPLTGKVIMNERSVNVRPKTFQLLILLVSSENTISKQQILAEIWDDVVVDDQVIFQSIKELRKIFVGMDVIKTYPRKGYHWISNVELIQEASELPQVAINIPAVEKQLNGRKSLWLIAAAICLFLLLLAGYFFKQSEPLVTGSVVVLPVTNDVEDSSHQWVRYGAMDQLIQRLSSNSKVGVLNTDYVMEVMTRANMPSDGFNREHIEKIFKVSGTALVIETVLTGTSGDYQLIYTLHQPTDIAKGAILAEDVGAAIDQLAFIINSILGKKSGLITTDYHSDFANEMLAEAIRLSNSDDHSGAEKLLEAIMVTEPENLTAQRLLVEIALQSKNVAMTDRLVAKAIPLAITKNNTKELIRLRFFAAIHAAQQGNILLAQQLISVMEADAKLINDWLYLAYAAEFTGSLNQKLTKFTLARAHFEQAILYHQVLRCPLGHSNGLMYLSALAHAQGDLNTAEDNAKKSLVIIKQHELLSLQPKVEMWLKNLAETKLIQGL